MMTMWLGGLSLVIALGTSTAMAAPRPGPGASGGHPAQQTHELAGLWEAKLRFGPDVHGPLLVERTADGWHAEIAGRSTRTRLASDTITFELPEGRGGFRGRLASDGLSIVGHWIQPGPRSGGGYAYFASPITLRREGAAERWRGDVHPLPDEFTMYLKVDPNADGSMRAFLKNPERNLGRFIRIAALERDGETVRLLGAPTESGRRVWTEGVLRGGVLSVPLRAGTYDFRRVEEDGWSDFYPRGRPGVGADYVYRTPMPLGDGWPVATPEEVGLSQELLEAFVRMIIDTPIDGVSVPEIHGVLIARRGKLVLEEYFHGEHRDKPHDTRSAAKSLTATLLGAAIQAGVPLTSQSSVYRVMNGGAFPSDLEPEKRALTLEHLLTMTQGLDCDDGNPDSRGNEGLVESQIEEPDWWKLTLGLDIVRPSGESPIYCSMAANLVGGVLQAAAGRSLPELFQELIAEPLEIRRYWLNLMPTGNAYMGGGMRFLPRDFMKLGQLMLNGGTWKGRRIVSEQWAERVTSPIVQFPRLKYGYLWWLIEYPYQGETLQAFYAAGNGGQVVMGIPELDLVVAIYAGNYSDRVSLQTQQELVPEFVLPAVGGEVKGYGSPSNGGG